MTTAYNAIPKFLAQESYKNPTTSAPFNLAYQTDLPVFKWREFNPENAKAGQAFMAAQRIGQRSVWDGLVPLHDFKMSQEDLDKARVLVCDVGGGSGHQCIDFRKHTPDIKGRIVTQDLGKMQELSNIKDELEKLDVTMMPHDFMTEQPVHGAKVYYLRNVIHK
jgi:demethylsterigmatocystin 6-O-methyltransferase